MAILLFIYYFSSAIFWGELVRCILPVGKNVSLILGFLMGFYLSAFAIAVPVVVWKYDGLSVFVAMIAVLLIGILLSLRPYAMLSFARRAGGGVLTTSPILQRIRARFKDFKDNIQSTIRFQSLSRAKASDLSRALAMTLRDKLVISFAALSAFFLFFIFHARTGVYILSPWDALSSFTLMLFFALCFIVVKMIFSSRPIALVMLVIILFSYMTHAYLPAVYETGFGGDKWRHIAAERWLQEGNVYTPSVWGEDEISMVSFGPLSIPEAFVAGNKTSYAAQWGVTIMISEALGVDLFRVDLLMVFLLWSLFLPLILFLFGRIIFENDRLGLLFAFLSTLFYTFQSEGAITIPVSFGHLFFFFVFLLWAYYVKEGRRSTLYAASALSLAFYWGYILNFFVLLIFGALAIAWRALFMERSHWYKFKLKHGFSDRRLSVRDKTVFALLVVGAVFAIPFLEIFQGLSSYSHGSLSVLSIINSLADAFGRLSGFIGIIVPPDFIDQGNFLYNQTKESLSRLPLFSYRAVPFIVSTLVWIIVCWNIYRIMRYRNYCHSEAKPKNFLSADFSKVEESLAGARDDNKTVILLAILFVVTMLSYFISWSFTEGVHILARRLNETIVFFMIIFLGYGIWMFLHERSVKIPQRKKILAICFCLSFAATSTYASGPKLQLVTSDELRAAEIVWQEHQKDTEPYCVLANTWPLLGMEAVSGKKIVGGNFPLYQEYAQPERVKIFEGMSKSPSETWINAAFRITKARVCYYMTENIWINDRVLDKTADFLGEPRRVGTVYVWRLEK